MAELAHDETFCESLSEGDSSTSLLCPKCASKKLWRDGNTYSLLGDKIQRWLCRDCGLRFSDPKDLQTARKLMKQVETVGTVDTKILKSKTDKVVDRRIKNSVEETKNLAAEQQDFEVLRGNEAGEFKQKIFEYTVWLRSNGRSEATIFGRGKLLKRLVKRGANLYDPESVKTTISKQTWGNGQKSNAVDAYSSFLTMVGGKWEAPVYKKIRKIPFIPKEVEIDQLIAGSSNRMATFLQLLKETGARCGEIWQLNWTDIDLESKVVNITPEKNSNPRVAHLSNKLIEMIQHLPKTYGERVFSLPHMRIDNFAVNFQRQRKRTTNKIRNQRILQIHFHTFRYWKGTMLYHQTKDMYYVMQRLGHKSIANTLLYVQLEEALFQGEDEYISKVARTEKEILALVEAGFEKVTDFQGAIIFRKRK
jgi:integrase/transposase-like protein